MPRGPLPIPSGRHSGLGWVRKWATGKPGKKLDALEKRISGLQPAAGNLAAQFLQSHPEAAANQPGHFTYNTGIVVWDPSDKLKRGPSTLAERQKAIEVARLLERDPLAPFLLNCASGSTIGGATFPIS